MDIDSLLSNYEDYQQAKEECMLYGWIADGRMGERYCTTFDVCSSTFFTNLEHNGFDGVDKFAKANNAEIVYYYKTNVHVSSPSKNIFCNGPLAFIYAIKNANYVIGDSFHACAFAILYNKQFAYNLNSTRINELMKKLNIKNRLIGVDWSVNEQVDYKKVNRLLDIYRKDSMGFLRKALLK